MNNFFSVEFGQRFLKRGVILLFYILLLGIFLYTSKLRDVLAPDRTLRIYTYVDNFAPECIKDFEEKYGVKVAVRYFDSNEELLAKFKISRGRGYDIITPSDYMVELLRREGLLRQLDYTQLSVKAELDPRLLNRRFDPGNHYSLPLMWIPYGVIFHKSIMRHIPDQISLGLLFTDPRKSLGGVKKPYRICMVDDSREAVFLASLFLFGEAEHFSQDRLIEIKNLLIEQKKWVESYVNQDLRYYLLSRIVDVALAPVVFVRKILEQSSDFGFMIPREGSIISIENIAIPCASTNPDLAHLFIDFILSKDVAHKNSSTYGFNPTNALAYDMVEPMFIQNQHIFPRGEAFDKMLSMHNDLPLKEFEEIWLAVKSA